MQTFKFLKLLDKVGFISSNLTSKRIRQTVIVILSLFFKVSAQEFKAPNILFAISDDQSFAHTSFAGAPFINTPTFDRLAKEGVYFSNCYAGSPGCAPSRSAIVTGRYPWQNEASGQHNSLWLEKFVPFTDELMANGYAVGKTGKGVMPFKYKKHKSKAVLRQVDAAGASHSNIMYKESEDKRTAKGIKKINYTADFKYFLSKKETNQPFFFWFGCKEPHRKFEKDSWKRSNKKLASVKVPGFLPDDEVVRGDLLDYAIEIEWFDLHLQQMLSHLEAIGELENTIVIVTSDNGMAFPRAKANCYEYGAHVPLLINFPKRFPGGKVVNSPASFIDLAPTILAMTQSQPKKMMPIFGKSMLPLLEGKPLAPSEVRQYACSGRERHTSSRHNNLGYPQRVIRKEDYLLIWNMRPERQPAGANQTYDLKDESKLSPPYKGKILADVDDSPTKSLLIKERKSPKMVSYFNLMAAKRPEFELYDVNKDPYCLNNLWLENAHQKKAKELKSLLLDELTKTKDPRVVGPNKDIFETYPSYRKLRKFPKPIHSNS